MSDNDWLVERFEANRAQLRALAYRMLGSAPEADDVVQEAWVRVSRADHEGVDNLSAWLTTVVGRLCLDVLRTRRARREEPIGDQIQRSGSRTHPLLSALAPTPSTSCSWPNSSGLFWLSWTAWHRPNGWRWCCMTCSACPSTRSAP